MVSHFVLKRNLGADYMMRAGPLGSRVAALTRSPLIGSWIIEVVKVAANEIVGIASRARTYVL